MSTLSAMDVFAARCDARAHLWAAWQLDLHSAVDVLQEAAEQRGLVARLGQDCIQRVMSDAFSKWRHT